MWDLTNVSESTVEPGEYTVSVAEAEVRQTKAGTGEYIKVKLETEKGQAFFHNFNVKNPNEQAVKIGMAQLKTFMRVSGKKDPNSLKSVDELLGLRCQVKVKLEESDFGTQARITSFKPAAKAAETNPFG